jgi:hypothetical protein
MRPSPALFRDTVTVLTWLGEGAYGPIYAEPVDVPCKVSTIRQLVRNSNGEEVVSEATISALPEQAAPFVEESQVIIAGRASTILSVAPESARGVVALVKVTCS